MRPEYTIHDSNTAPERSRPALEQTQARFGRVPNLIGAMAQSPELLNEFLRLTAVSEQLTLPILEREVVSLVTGVEARCPHCQAVHTGALKRVGAPQSLIHSLRVGGPICDTRLAVLADFTRQLIAQKGNVPDETQAAFFASGFTAAHALEVIFLVAVLSMSTHASRLMGVPLDSMLKTMAS